LEIARTTSFGYTQILGELPKLGVRKISRQTVRNILKEEGIRPGPNRSSDCWIDFLKRHGETLWACDFFSVKSVTAYDVLSIRCAAVRNPAIHFAIKRFPRRDELRSDILS
jgi:hypothetical protein